MHTRKCQADANADANANRICTKNNMSPYPGGGILNAKGRLDMSNEKQDSHRIVFWIFFSYFHDYKVYHLSMNLTLELQNEWKKLC